MRVQHPSRGELPVQVIAGRPQVSKALAMDLIKEFEDHQSRIHLAKVQLESFEARELSWLKAMVDSHPALRDLPEYVKSALLQEPSDCSVTAPDESTPAEKVQKERRSD